MEATKLIEEAEMLCAVASAAPWRCEHGRGRFEIKSGAVSLAGVLYEQDRDFIVGARTLVPALTAALKASEEQNGAIRRGLDWERAEREKVAEFARKIGRERDDLAAANLAANKRIEALEHERDAALLATKEAQRLAFNAEQKARALDAVQRDTIARLEAQIEELRAELARLTTPRPIAEAPRDGTNILGVWLTSSAPEVMHWDGSYWTDEGEELVYKPTHYLPLPEVKP